MTRVKMGSIYTDTASLLLVDPCRVLRREDVEDGDGKVPDYEALMAVVFPTESGAEAAEWSELLDKASQRMLTDEECVRLKAIKKQSTASPAKALPFADGLYVRGDSDGWYHVWLETEDGKERLVIELDARVEP